MDFGLAKRDAGEITMTLDGQVLGTPAYMPPVQARGEGHDVDARGDVYSLGVILNTLGVAQYRVGQYAAALETLTRSDKINTAGPNGPQSTDLAFLAMTQHQLGQPAPARATLARLRETLQQAPRGANDADAQAFLREAEVLIEQR